MVLSTRFKLLAAGLLGLACATPPVIDKELMIISEFDVGSVPGAEYQVARDLGYNGEDFRPYPIPMTMVADACLINSHVQVQGPVPGHDCRRAWLLQCNRHLRQWQL